MFILLSQPPQNPLHGLIHLVISGFWIGLVIPLSNVANSVSGCPKTSKEGVGREVGKQLFCTQTLNPAFVALFGPEEFLLKLWGQGVKFEISHSSLRVSDAKVVQVVGWRHGRPGRGCVLGRIGHAALKGSELRV